MRQYFAAGCFLISQDFFTVTCCHRCLPGVKWIKQKYGEELRAIRIGQKGYLDTIEAAIIKGYCDKLPIKLDNNRDFRCANCSLAFVRN